MRTGKEEKYNRRRLQSSYMTTLVSITLVLFMLGSLGLIILHAQTLSAYVKENISIRILIKESSKEADIIKLKRKLDASDYVKSSEYITREMAAEELKKDLGEDFISFLGYNPLPPTIDLRLKSKYATIRSIDKIEKEILANKIVKELYYQKSLVNAINQNIHRISIILSGFSFLLLLIAIALINNTIRLSVYAKRFIINSMQLVGATKSFIRKPFLYKGILQGIYSALIAILLIAGLVYFSISELPELAELQNLKNYLILSAAILLTGILITTSATFLAIRKYLKMKSDDLYY